MNAKAEVAADVLRVGVGGPVGSGKTALVDALCKRMRDRYNLAVVTNDIYTKEDCEFLIRSEALPAERRKGYWALARERTQHPSARMADWRRSFVG